MLFRFPLRSFVGVLGSLKFENQVALTDDVNLHFSIALLDNHVSV